MNDLRKNDIIGKTLYYKKENREMKKTLVAIMTAVMVLSNGLTVFAAPETMSDGTIFDAEYYAQNNPDVAAVLGTGKDALYQHYLSCGKAEGRQAFADSAIINTAADTSISAQVNALGITYDPSRDEKLLLQWYSLRPVSNNWKGTFNIFGVSSEEERERLQKEAELYYSTRQFVRADYTNDPLYLALAQELMKSRELFHQSNFDTQYYTITYFDQIGDIRFRDMDREYLLNVTSNLALDYMESILGYDLTWIQSINQVADFTDNAEVSHNKAISLCVCPSLVRDFWGR